MNTPIDGSLVDMMVNPVNFEEAMRERLKLRDVMEEVLVEAHDQEEVTPGNELCKMLDKAKEEFKSNIEVYNRIKDEGLSLQIVKDKLHNVYTNVNINIDFISNNIKPDLIDGIDVEVTSVLKRYYEKINKILDDEINDKNLKSLECKKKIKDYKYLFSHNSGGYISSICLTNEVTQFCDPCGHSYCHKCLKSTYCYICRVKINKVHRLYL